MFTGKRCHCTFRVWSKLVVDSDNKLHSASKFSKQNQFELKEFWNFDRAVYLSCSSVQSKIPYCHNNFNSQNSGPRIVNDWPDATWLKMVKDGGIACLMHLQWMRNIYRLPCSTKLYASCFVCYLGVPNFKFSSNALIISLLLRYFKNLTKKVFVSLMCKCLSLLVWATFVCMLKPGAWCTSGNVTIAFYNS